MNREKRYIFWRVMVVACALVSVACSADMNGDMYMPEKDNPDYITAFGMLDSEQMRVVADNGTTLHITDLGGQTSMEDIESHEGRVLINYTILGNNYEGGFSIRLNRFYPLEVKDLEIYDGDDHPELESVAEWKDENFVSLLDAPAMPYEASIGGGYININVCYTSAISPDNEMPDVELYYDTTCSTFDTAVLQLVCEREEEMYESGAKNHFRWFSFRIGKLVEALIVDTNIYAFHWCWWAEEGHPEAGVKEYTSVMNINSYGSMDKVSRPAAFEN